MTTETTITETAMAAALARFELHAGVVPSAEVVAFARRRALAGTFDAADAIEHEMPEDDYDAIMWLAMAIEEETEDERLGGRLPLDAVAAELGVSIERLREGAVVGLWRVRRDGELYVTRYEVDRYLRDRDREGWN